MAGFVYILASKRNGTLYTGSATDLVRRVWAHKQKAIPGFTADYGCTLLVWFEQYDQIAAAYQRERQIKKWRRAWKLSLIEQTNPHWRDLYNDLASLPRANASGDPL